MSSNGRVSKVVTRAVEEVRQKVAANEYLPGSALPSENDLAAQLSTSRGTIRNAIELLVKSGELSRRPHSRPIITGRTAAVDIGRGEEIPVWVSRPLADGAILEFLRGVSRTLQGTSFRMVVRDPRKFTGQIVKSDERHFLMDRLSDSSFPGAIIWRNSFAHNDDLMRRLGDTGKPIVYVDTPPPPNVRGDYVGSANALGARGCIDFLAGLGHTRIVFVADTIVPETVKDRMHGYMRAMKTNGLEDQAQVLLACEERGHLSEHANLAGPYARYSQGSIYFQDLASRAVGRILSMSPMPTAVFACHDVLAAHIHALLSGLGIRVPDDISLVGFDWIAENEKGFPDELTTAAQSFEGFGRHAADLILDRASGELPATNRYVLLDAPLIERPSTAPSLPMPVLEPARILQGIGASL